MSKTRTRSFPPILLALAAVCCFTLFFSGGCGDDSGFRPSNGNPAVELSPDSTGVKPGGQVTFTATVTGLSSNDLTWYVNDEPGGNVIVGTISTAGLYTAPLFLPDDPKVTIKAVSVADTMRFAEVYVLIIESVAVELEDYTTTTGDSGLAIKRVGCSAASGGLAAGGFDQPGDGILCEVSFEYSGYYSGVLWAAAGKNAQVRIKATIAQAGLIEEDQVAEFEIIGKGLG